LGRTLRLLRALGPRALDPRLLLQLARTGWRFRARGWYRRAPFLPLPPAEYLEWRLHTAYGNEDRVPTRDELERYVRWANRMADVHGNGG
jgi:hypothetical protein